MTGDSKHTPGPYELREGGKVYSAKYKICDVGIGGRTYEEFWATGQLLAAAPLMLEALQNLMNGITSGAIKTDYDETMEHAVIKAHAAIASATGEA